MRNNRSISPALVATALALWLPTTQAVAQTLSQQRAAGEAELRQFTQKEIVATTAFISQRDPTALSAIIGRQLKGCPSSPIEQPAEQLPLIFSTGNLGPWAGDLDGSNISIKTPLGEVGNALGIPSVNTIDIVGNPTGGGLLR